MPTAYFGDIRSKIIDRLELAKDSIKIAMAWFTNQVLFQVVMNKAAGGVKIELILSDSEANYRTGSSLNFSSLQRKGADIYIACSVDHYQFLHHKFVVIDEKEVITGSYNWSSNAHTNLENIVIIEDISIARNYSLQFNALKAKETTASLDKFFSSDKVKNITGSQEADATMFKLAQEFNQAVDDAMQEAEDLRLGLRLDIVEGMIKRYTAVGAAKKLSNDDEQSGFLKLVAENRPDLTFEYLTAKTHFAPLFDKVTVRNAKNKLRPYLGQEVDQL